MFLFCESAMIALWHGKQVETAFFSQINSIMYKKLTRVGVRLKYCCHTTAPDEIKLLKKGESLNQASYQLWLSRGKCIVTTGKIKATAAIVIAGTGP